MGNTIILALLRSPLGRLLGSQQRRGGLVARHPVRWFIASPARRRGIGVDRFVEMLAQAAERHEPRLMLFAT